MWQRKAAPCRCAQTRYESDDVWNNLPHCLDLWAAVRGGRSIIQQPSYSSSSLCRLNDHSHLGLKAQRVKLCAWGLVGCLRGAYH
jgi:hypothetical protein